MLHADIVNIQVCCDFAIWALHDLELTFCDTPQHQQAIQLVFSALDCCWRGTTEYAEVSTELSLAFSSLHANASLHPSATAADI